MPQGVIHAYTKGADHTVCGVDLGTLHLWEDELFGRLLNACPRCQALVRVNPDVIDLTVFDREPAEDPGRDRSSADRNGQ